jgi:hypothetical protein
MYSLKWQNTRKLWHLPSGVYLTWKPVEQGETRMGSPAGAVTALPRSINPMVALTSGSVNAAPIITPTPPAAGPPNAAQIAVPAAPTAAPEPTPPNAVPILVALSEVSALLRGPGPSYFPVAIVTGRPLTMICVRLRASFKGRVAATSKSSSLHHSSTDNRVGRLRTPW